MAILYDQLLDICLRLFIKVTLLFMFIRVTLLDLHHIKYYTYFFIESVNQCITFMSFIFFSFVCNIRCVLKRN